VGERRDFIFGVRVDHSNSKPMDGKLIQVTLVSPYGNVCRPICRQYVYS